jgi:hypothetical protein
MHLLQVSVVAWSQNLPHVPPDIEESQYMEKNSFMLAHLHLHQASRKEKQRQKEENVTPPPKYIFIYYFRQITCMYLFFVMNVFPLCFVISSIVKIKGTANGIL